MQTRRGTVLVAVLIAFVIMGIAVIAIVHGGARQRAVTVDSLQGERAAAAASGVAHMAVKELFDRIDRDGDGGVGTISGDNNAANDPSIGGAQAYATEIASGGVTTVIARGRTADTQRAVQVTVADAGATATGATVLLVVVNSASLMTEELARKSLIESWGYTTATISATASQAAFDAAAQQASVAYIVETCLSSDIGTKLTAATIGVITEESALSDEFGFAASMTTLSTTQVEVINSSHYITSGLPTGVYNVFSSSQPVRYLSGTQGGYTALARQPSTSNIMLAVMERGDTLTPSGTAAGRRVYLPFGNTYFDLASLTSAGQIIMRRSIEWCLLPVAYWSINDGSGSTVTESISARHGTRIGPTWTTGRISQALNFDGVDDYVTVPDDPAFRVTTAFSVAGWIYARSWNYGDFACVILRKGDANPNNWQLAVTDGAVRLSLDDYDAYGIRANTTLALNTWYHVAGTWDGSTVRLYVNGVLDNTPYSRAAPINTDTRALYLGGRIGSTDVTNGLVDEVYFYNRALTAAEVAALAGAKPRITSWASIQP